MSDPTAFPDPERVPDLTELPRRRSTLRPGSRRARRAEAAIARAEEAARARAAEPALSVVSTADVPHVRLGLAWAGATAAVTFAGRGWTGAWCAFVAGLAAAQVARAHRRSGARPLVGVAAGLGAALPLAAVAGVGEVAAACAAGIGVALVGRLVLVGEVLGRPTDDVARTIVAGVVPGLAAATLVLVRGLGRTEALVLFALVAAHDAGSFLAGAGAAGRWEGPLTGAACTIPVTLAVAALWTDPFAGASPWVLGGIAAVTAPLGPALARVLVPAGRAPALGRLDSLLVTGPIWAWAALALLR